MGSLVSTSYFIFLVVENAEETKAAQRRNLARAINRGWEGLWLFMRSFQASLDLTNCKHVLVVYLPTIVSLSLLFLSLPPSLLSSFPSFFSSFSPHIGSSCHCWQELDTTLRVHTCRVSGKLSSQNGTKDDASQVHSTYHYHTALVLLHYCLPYPTGCSSSMCPVCMSTS